MSPTQRHILKYPSARTTTIAYLEKREQTTEQLRREIERAAAAKRVNEYRDGIGYVSWPRRVLSALVRGWGAV
jgi:flagellar biosynthesis regulator FlaF